MCPPLTRQPVRRVARAPAPDEFAYLDDRYADEIAAYRGRMAAIGPAPSAAGADDAAATPAADGEPAAAACPPSRPVRRKRPVRRGRGGRPRRASRPLTTTDGGHDDAARERIGGSGRGAGQRIVRCARRGAEREREGGTVDEARGNEAGGTVVDVAERPDATEGEAAVDLAEGDAVVDLVDAPDVDGHATRDQTSGQG